MDEVYEPTEERERIVAGLEAIEREAVALAETVTDRASAHRVRNVAQSAASQKSLLIQDWQFADRERAAADERAA